MSKILDAGHEVVILPDVRGLHAYYRELALRLAEHGVDAIAIDYFARTAGIGDRGPDFDWAAHVPQTTYETLRADVTAAHVDQVGWDGRHAVPLDVVPADVAVAEAEVAARPGCDWPWRSRPRVVSRGTHTGFKKARGGASRQRPSP